jgi:hypothetical protein
MGKSKKEKKLKKELKNARNERSKYAQILDDIIALNPNKLKTISYKGCEASIQIKERSKCPLGADVESTDPNVCEAQKVEMSRLHAFEVTRLNTKIKGLENEMLINASQMIPKKVVLKSLNTILSRYSELLTSYNYIKNNLDVCGSKYKSKILELQNLAHAYIDDLDNFKHKCLKCNDLNNISQKDILMNNKKALYLYKKVHQNLWKTKILVLFIVLIIILIGLRSYHII